jgi:hypothetical protein
MTDYAAINYLAVLIAAVVGFALGGAWFAQPVFGAAWLKALGKTKEQICSGGSPRNALILTAITTLVTAYVLAVFIQALGITTALGGALVGLSIGIGIVATSMYSDSLFCNWPFRLILIQAGHRIVYLSLMGGILGAWR